jgi:hypothetical protein
MAKRHCEFPTCDTEAVGEPVMVSLDRHTVELRNACFSCSEVLASGIQHGRMRAWRQLMAAADEMSRTGANTEAACYRLAAELVLTSHDDPAEEVRPGRARRWRWTPRG